jgi:hypothetical protein
MFKFVCVLYIVNVFIKSVCNSYDNLGPSAWREARGNCVFQFGVLTAFQSCLIYVFLVGDVSKNTCFIR